MAQKEMEIRHYVRIGADEPTYPSGVVPGARLLKLCTDAAGELSIRRDGKTSMLARLHDVNFLEPVYAGESLSIWVRTTRVGNRSRDNEFGIDKTTRMRYREGRYQVEVLDPPVPVLRGKSTSVVSKE